MDLKRHLRALTPPILWTAAHRLRNRPDVPGFEGPISSWEEAEARTKGWDSPEITAKTLQAALKVKDGLAAMEQDGNALDYIRYSTVILLLITIASIKNRGSVRIVDFGGGLGANFFQNRKLVEQCSNVEWRIVERRDIVQLGLQHFQTSKLKFYTHLEEALTGADAPSALLFSGSFQFVEKPFVLLDKIHGSSVNILAFDRLLVWEQKNDAVFIQNPDPERYYRANYPTWVFSKCAFSASLREHGFSIVEDLMTYNVSGPFLSGIVAVRD
jgi:putative methyltransferase (TIGR04325 family)